MVYGSWTLNIIEPYIVVADLCAYVSGVCARTRRAALFIWRAGRRIRQRLVCLRLYSFCQLLFAAALPDDCYR